MTYADSESSVRGSKPTELYKFEGTYENYYYTSGVRSIDFDDGDGTGSHTYTSIALQRSEIAAGTEQDDGLNINIDMPVSTPLVLVYGFESSPPTLNLTIYRYTDLADVIAYWKGPVAQIQINDGVATVQSISELSTALAADFPNVYYQQPCNNALFDARCQVIEANFSGTAHVGAINGNAISVDAIPSGATGIALDGMLVGGEMRLPSGERRMIVSQVGVVIGINFPFSQIAADEVVNITAGCDHGYTSDCKNKFANQKNFGGFPFVSQDNPFTTSIAGGSTLPDDTCTPAVFEGWYWKILFQEGFSGGTLTPPAQVETLGSEATGVSTHWDGQQDTGEYWEYWLYDGVANEDGKSVKLTTFRPAGSHPGAHITEYYHNPADPDHDGTYAVMRVFVQRWDWTDPVMVIYGYSQAGSFGSQWFFNLNTDPGSQGGG